VADIEIVKVGLKYHRDSHKEGCVQGSQACPYITKGDRCFHILLDDALSVINEQQAEIERLETAMTDMQPIKPDIDGKACRCGRCDDFIMSTKQTRVPINRERIRFCGHCGQPIDWYDIEKDGEQEC